MITQREGPAGLSFCRSDAESAVEPKPGHHRCRGRPSPTTTAVELIHRSIGVPPDVIDQMEP